MDILINKKKHTVTENATLQSIVSAQLGDKQKGVAVAVNDTVIPKSNWDSHLLQANDSVLIIKATQGG